MNTREQYRFDDFTTSNYVKLLQLTKERYPFHSYAEAKTLDRYVVWRHDVDLSPHRALALARIEANAGVRSTYFLNFHSEFYNLLEKSVMSMVHDIAAMGHHIGLHFDHVAYGVEDLDSAEPLMDRERTLLSSTFGVPVDVFSFHYTNTFSRLADMEMCAGMQNATSRHFRERAAYCSDSTGIWRFERLEDVLLSGEQQRIQVLTHPELWQDEAMSPAMRYKRCVYGRADSVWSWINAFLAEGGHLLVED
jgi:hypothetical protein